MNITLDSINVQSRPEEVDKWVQRFQALCVLQEYKEDTTKTVALISLMGSQAYDLVASAVAPKEPREYKVEALIEILKKQMHPTKSVVISRYEFFNTRQKPEETVRELERKLKTRASSCEFGTKLDEYLRDQFVCAVHTARKS